MAVRGKKKDSRSAAAARKASAAARKGWETRRAKAREEERKRARWKKRKAEREAAKLHAKRSEAAKRGAKKRKARERTQAALDTWLTHAGQRGPHGNFVRETKVLHEAWLRQKRELLREVDYDWDAYLDILDQVAEASGTEWDIAYGPDGEGAVA